MLIASIIGVIVWFDLYSHKEGNCFEERDKVHSHIFLLETNRLQSLYLESWCYYTTDHLRSSSYKQEYIITQDYYVCACFDIKTLKIILKWSETTHGEFLTWTCDPSSSSAFIWPQIVLLNIEYCQSWKSKVFLTFAPFETLPFRKSVSLSSLTSHKHNFSKPSRLKLFSNDCTKKKFHVYLMENSNTLSWSCFRGSRKLLLYLTVYFKLSNGL